MANNQNTEYQESWRDEYLKSVCAFANAQGGRLCIGVRDDGVVSGVSGSRKLVQDIPDRIMGTMGITADASLLSRDGKDYIEIMVSPSPVLIRLRGEYYYRSGSTVQQLCGIALTDFLARKTGCWDALPTTASMADLDRESFEIFRREAVRNRRLTAEDLDISDEQLLECLGLMENGRLKRAAVMLFGRKPGRFIPGCCVKVGKFGKESDLQYQDTVEGSLFHIADHIMDLIYTKYLTKTPKLETTCGHDVRAERYPFHREGVREAVYNALVHNNYEAGVPIEIRIQDDALSVSNSCILPQGWTTETLLGVHRSEPCNSLIARAFYRAGWIESWGCGIEKVLDSCKELGSPAPQYTVSDDCLTVRFTALASAVPNGQSGGINGAGWR